MSVFGFWTASPDLLRAIREGSDSTRWTTVTEHASPLDEPATPEQPDDAGAEPPTTEGDDT